MQEEGWRSVGVFPYGPGCMLCAFRRESVSFEKQRATYHARVRKRPERTSRKSRGERRCAHSFSFLPSRGARPLLMPLSPNYLPPASFRPMIEAAQAHYLSGAQFFESGSYDAALVEFEAAFRLSGESDFCSICLGRMRGRTHQRGHRLRRAIPLRCKARRIRSGHAGGSSS